MIKYEQLKQNKHDRELLVETAKKFYQKHKNFYNLLCEEDIEVFFDLSFNNHTDTFTFKGLTQIFSFSTKFKSELINNEVLPSHIIEHYTHIHGQIHLALLNQRKALFQSKKEIKDFIKKITSPDVPF